MSKKKKNKVKKSEGRFVLVTEYTNKRAAPQVCMFFPTKKLAKRVFKNNKKDLKVVSISLCKVVKIWWASEAEEG